MVVSIDRSESRQALLGVPPRLGDLALLLERHREVAQDRKSQFVAIAQRGSRRPQGPEQQLLGGGVITAVKLKRRQQQGIAHIVCRLHVREFTAQRPDFQQVPFGGCEVVSLHVQAGQAVQRCRESRSFRGEIAIRVQGSAIELDSLVKMALSSVSVAEIERRPGCFPVLSAIEFSKEEPRSFELFLGIRVAPQAVERLAQRQPNRRLDSGARGEGSFGTLHRLIQRRFDSCVGGQISAPGQLILSTAIANTHNLASGTSPAAAHVSGIVSYLYALEPGLTHLQVKQALGANLIDVVDGADQVDAWAAAMDVDRLTSSDRVLRLLLDIDDGTLDGNTRVEAESSVDFTNEDVDQDGGIGDGQIDMADFRRWRDWLLQVEDSGSLVLDGSDSHPKKDVNGNGVVESAEEENTYPRGDFNGDGQLSRDAASQVPGAAAATGNADKTDLEVLQALFDDEHYLPGDLDELIESADIEVAPFNCLFNTNVDMIRSSVLDLDGVEVDFRFHGAGDVRRIFTVPVSNPTYTVRMEAIDADGDTLFTDETEFDVGLGGDYYWDPDVCKALLLEITFPTLFEPGVAMPLLVRVGREQEDGSILYVGGVDVDVQLSGGTADPSSGTTDADGFFSSEITPGENAENVTVFVTATDESGFSVTQSATANPMSGPVTLTERKSRVYATAVVTEGDGSGQTNFFPFSGSGPFVRSITVQDGGARATATQDSSLTIDPILGLTGGTLSATILAQIPDVSVDPEFPTRAEASDNFSVNFSIPAGSFYQYTASGSVTFDDGDPYLAAFYVGPSGAYGPQTRVFFQNPGEFGEVNLGTTVDLSDSQILGPGTYSLSTSIFNSVVLGETALSKEGTIEFQFTLVPTVEP